MPCLGRALGDDISYAEFTFERAWLAELAGLPTKRVALRPVMKFRDPVLHGLTGRLVQLAGESDDMARMLRENLARLIGLRLMREYAPSAPVARNERSSLPGPLRRRLEDYIAAHPDQRLSLDELANLAGLPVHRLISAFRLSFGQTPLQYIIDQRLQLACRSLESTRRDIAAIAMEPGFSSHSHLSHAFKQLYGLTPREFRQRAEGS